MSPFIIDFDYVIAEDGTYVIAENTWSVIVNAVEGTDWTKEVEGTGTWTKESFDNGTWTKKTITTDSEWTKKVLY